MPSTPPNDPKAVNALMFGEEPDDEAQAFDASPQPARPPTIDGPKAAAKAQVGAGQDQDAVVGCIAPDGRADNAAPAADSPGEQSDTSPATPSSRGEVVSILNTPRTHSRARGDDSQDLGNDKGREDSEPDWDAIEQQYRTGIISVPALAANYHVHHTTIYRRAKKYGWTHNLAHKVRACAEQTLLFGSPSKGKGATRTGEGTDPHAQEADIIEAAASVQVQVVRQHRKDLSKLRTLQARLVEQAETFFTDQDSKNSLITDLAELQTAVQTVESLSRTVGRVIPLERAAFNIDAKQGPATETQAIERRVQAAADRKRASPDDPQAVQRATRALNDARRRQKLTDRHLADHGIEPSRGE